MKPIADIIFWDVLHDLSHYDEFDDDDDNIALYVRSKLEIPLWHLIRRPILNQLIPLLYRYINPKDQHNETGGTA